MRRLFVLLVSAALFCGYGVVLSAQDQNGPKQDLKNAGHSSKEAAKSTGQAVKKGTKKAVHAGAKKTRQGAGKVEDKTRQ